MKIKFDPVACYKAFLSFWYRIVSKWQTFLFFTSVFFWFLSSSWKRCTLSTAVIMVMLKVDCIFTRSIAAATWSPGLYHAGHKCLIAIVNTLWSNALKAAAESTNKHFTWIQAWIIIWIINAAAIDTLAESEYLHMITPFPPNGVTQRRVRERFPWQPCRGYRVHCTE